MAELICRACRHPVVPGTILCPSCGANLTSLDAVVDAAPSPSPSPELEPEPEPGSACPECHEPVPDGDPVCPHCMVPLPTGGIVLRLADGGWRYVIAPGASLVLGRDPRQSPAAAILGPYETVSRRHAEVTVDAGRRVTVTDAGSTNGTFVDDAPVAEGARVELRAGARLRLGRSVLLLVEPEDP
jgi:RNA polymerase subunit RPABC4/transcription elongation factor Spt4